MCDGMRGVPLVRVEAERAASAGAMDERVSDLSADMLVSEDGGGGVDEEQREHTKIVN